MRFRSLATAVFFLIVLSACTGGAEEATPATTPTSAPESTSTSKPEPTSTTQPESTSTTAPESTSSSTTTPSVSEEDAAASAHTRFLTELFARDERVVGEGDRVVALAEELTTGPLLSRILSDTPERIAAGELIVGPGYLSNIISLEVSGDVANIVDCSQDRTEGYDSQGQLTVAADDFFKIRGTRLVRVDGEWLVSEFFTGGDDRCDPDNS